MAQVRRHIGRYEVVRELGRGGMAVVYLAFQPGLEREVALKELAAFHVEDPAFVERFLRESRVAGSLSHPNIVTVYDFFEHENVPYIAMEYLERGSLRALVGHLSLAQVAGVMEGMLAGLNHAQRRAVVHRDLKPENLLITDEGGIKIADFGIAKAVNQASTGAYRTATGMAIGTPAYMAPEQATAQEVGSWTDLYTTGVIAYELLVGRVPFGGVDTPMAVLWKHVHEPPPPPSSVRPDLDRSLAAWLERMLAKEPGNRPAGPTAAWEELEEIVIGLLGPRWRRDARLLDRASDEPTPEPLTPATFYEEVTPETPAAAAPPVEVSAPPPVAPSPPPEPVVAQAPTIPPAVPPAPGESFVWPAPERRRRIDVVPLAVTAGLLVVALLISATIYSLTRDGEEATPPPPPGDAFARFRGAEEAFGGPGDQAMRTLLSQRGDVFAAGVDGSGGEGDAALWALADDVWTRLSAEGLGGPGAQTATALAGNGEVAVAVGWSELDGDRDAAAWLVAEDGVELTCALDSVCGDAALPGPDRRQEMLGAASAAGGGFVAVGRDVEPAGSGFDAAAWHSEDGRTWTRVELSAEAGASGPGSQSMNDVASTGTGLVAVGRDGLDAAVWRSPDGLVWERVRSDTLTQPGAQEMLAVTAGGPGLVVVGYDDVGEQLKREAAVWVFDGVDWRREASDDLAAPGGQEMRAVAKVGDRIVAGGVDRARDDGDAAIWTSEDGLSWTSIAGGELAGEGAQAIDAVAALGGAPLAAGDATSAVLSDQDAAVWVPES